MNLKICGFRKKKPKFIWPRWSWEMPRHKTSVICTDLSFAHLQIKGVDGFGEFQTTLGNFETLEFKRVKTSREWIVFRGRRSGPYGEAELFFAYSLGKVVKGAKAHQLWGKANDEQILKL